MYRRIPKIQLFEAVQRDADLLCGRKLNLIQVLFDGLSAALSAAHGHSTHHALDKKHKALSRAQRIIKGLQLTLDTRVQAGLSSTLGQLYGYMGERLWHAQVRQDNEAIIEVLMLTRTLSAAWQSLSPPVSPMIEMPPAALYQGRIRASVTV